MVVIKLVYLRENGQYFIFIGKGSLLILFTIRRCLCSDSIDFEYIYFIRDKLFSFVECTFRSLICKQKFYTSLTLKDYSIYA